MTGYRLYFMSSLFGQISHYEDFDAEDDAKAIEIAGLRECSQPLELWCQTRKVASYGPHATVPVRFGPTLT